jgi:hypothetical protein
MSRQFGTEITGNRGKKEELTPEASSGIISKWEAGVMNKDLATAASKMCGGELSDPVRLNLLGVVLCRTVQPR